MMKTRCLWLLLVLLPASSRALRLGNLAQRLLFPGQLRGRPTSTLQAQQAALRKRGGTLLSAEGFPITEEDHSFLKESLLRNVLFTSLPDGSLETLIHAFETLQVQKDDVIVQQGDPAMGDYVYVVGKGECTVTVDNQVVPEPYGTLLPMSIFGELGVLYNSTRGATVTAKSDRVVLYRINGTTFNHVLNKQSDDTPEEFMQIDKAIQQVAGTKSLYGGDIIRTYKPNRFWLWAQFSGTILQHNLLPTLLNMLYSITIIMIIRAITDPTRPLGLAPDSSHPLIARLAIFEKIWGLQMTLTTFILTFFVNQAFSFWQEVYSIGRRIQGRLNDFHLVLATSAKRNKDGTYTRESEKLLDDVGSSSRLLHALLWASCARRFKILLTPRGLKTMASRGLMTSKQLEVLLSLDVPNNQRHNACLEWMMVRAWQGIDDGTIRDQGTAQKLMEKMCDLRSTYSSIGDKLTGRMPLAYTHFVQILVDTFVLGAPLALYADYGAWSVLAVGILTLFYTGLLDLAKVFLDPLDNEDWCPGSIYMDLGVLIRESNAGSTRWKNSGARLPFSPSIA
jgi:predicted membrane chloride channel (bestrophin family)